MTGSDHLALGALRVIQELHEFMYVARSLPGWLYVPDATPLTAMFPEATRIRSSSSPTSSNSIRMAVDKWAHKIDGPNPIDRLSGISVIEQIVHKELDLAAIEARDSGMSWANVGSAIGITRQSAFVRWSKPGTATAPTGSPERIDADRRLNRAEATRDRVDREADGPQPNSSC